MDDANVRRYWRNMAFECHDGIGAPSFSSARYVMLEELSECVRPRVESNEGLIGASCLVFISP